MSLSAPVFAVVAAAVEHNSTLPVPALVYGLASAGTFVLLGFIVWSFRDVANRHSHKTSGSAGHGPDQH